jgi:prophage regulatory protein
MRLLRLNEVCDRTGVSRAVIYKLIAKEQFPRQIQITERCVGWSEDDVQNWILAKLEGKNWLARS